MSKVAIAGNIILDVIKMIDIWPQNGMLCNILEQEQAVGGCVANTAVDLKRLDPSIEVICYGVLGNDEYGKYVENELASYGLDISNVIISKNNSTSYTDVMTIPTGERTFFHNKGCYRDYDIGDINVDQLDCDLFHLGYLLLLDKFDAIDKQFGTRAARLLSTIQQKGIKTCVDLVSDSTGRFKEVVIPTLKYCNYIVINEVESGLIVDINPRKENGDIDLNNLKQICHKLKEYGVKEKVVIHAPEVSCIFDENNNFIYVPSLKLPNDYIVGTVGAGDAFCSAMLYSFIKNLDNEYSLRLASCVAACNLSVKDSISGARSAEESIKLDNLYERREI